MYKNLIYDTLNPMVVATVVVRKGYRLGKHPLKIKLQKQKLPKCLWFLIDDTTTWKAPEVVLYGESRYVLLRIECDSNRDAKKLKKQLLEQLDNYLG